VSFCKINPIKIRTMAWGHRVNKIWTKESGESESGHETCEAVRQCSSGEITSGAARSEEIC
jgi:hypothetical protein